MTTYKLMVYGGRGALGNVCINHFKQANWWVASIDLKPNPIADYNIIVAPNATWYQQEKHVMTMLDTALKDGKLDAIVCVAGGYRRGNAAKNLIENTELMWKQSVWPSSIAASVATKYLCNGGLLALTGARAALASTPDSIGYGMAKAAVHNLTKSLGSKDSGMPPSSTTVGILPMTLDTDVNRKCMPNANFSTWTPLSFIPDLLESWIKGVNCPPSGSLVKLDTKNYITEVILPKTKDEEVEVITE
ncbi:dihydropteridine reductase-like [Spodoptera frugiperda]|uniref:Dihydropteridine reductase n=1 Tax=Spodoptera frugiperda TaxID=7108 RepID=A0A9R0CZM6_SPOFR|nr:dihydropteridine reductase-like [Spodoptera frugiperda]